MPSPTSSPAIFELRSVEPADSAGYQEFGLHNRRERIVAILAASLGVLTVAAIAALMGMV